MTVRGALAALAGLAALSLGGGCATSRTAPVPDAEASRARESWERARLEAWRPRRFKALFRGESVPRAGAVVRGFLTVFWDGESLTWRVSAPLAGGVSEGRLGRSGGTTGRTPLPGQVRPQDAIGALLGVLDLPAGAAPVRREGESMVLSLPDGRAARLDASGRVVELSLGGEARVRLEPGAGVPRRIEASGPDGRVVLALESYGPWEAEEALPASGEDG